MEYRCDSLHKILVEAICLPEFATMITVPLRVTSDPNDTSPDTVRWSSSRMFGVVVKRDRKPVTSLNLSPLQIKRSDRMLTSLISGTVPNVLARFITSSPCSSLYRSLITRNKSQVPLTGKNLDLGTFTWLINTCILSSVLRVRR